MHIYVHRTERIYIHIYTYISEYHSTYLRRRERKRASARMREEAGVERWVDGEGGGVGVWGCVGVGVCGCGVYALR